MARGLAEAVLGEIHPKRVSPKVAGAAAQPTGSRNPAPAGGTGNLYARLWRAGQGGASVVLKKIHNGGTHSAKELGKQLDYLFSKATWCGGNAVNYGDRRQALTPAERREVVASWTEAWQRSPKNGHTTHLLLSFPAHVTVRKARIIAEDWAADMFEDPVERGDQWAYVAALHTDKAHPHLHVVVQNRGLETGQWFYMARGHVFDLHDMKDRLAEIAAEHGVALETTSRVERGVLTYGADRAEIESARREGRAVQEIKRTDLALETALAEVAVISAAYRELAFIARATEARDVAARMAAASRALAEGRPFIPRAEEFPMSGSAPVEMPEKEFGRAVDAEIASLKSQGYDKAHISSRSQEIEAKVREDFAAASEGRATRSHADFRSHVEGWMERVSGKLGELSAADQAELRPEFNAIAGKAMEALGDKRGAELAREAPRSALYGSAFGKDATVLAGAEATIAPDRAERLRASILDAAETTGLDREAVAARIASGAASALEERQWVKADIQRVAAAKGYDLGDETDRQTTAGIVDRFYEKAAGMIAEVRGLRVETAADQLRRTLTTMASVEARQGQVRFESDADALRLAEDMKARYGERIVKDLAAGKTDALAKDFADEGQRAKIAGAIISAAITHEGFGLTPREAEAARELIRAEPAAERKTERQQTRDRDRDLER